MEGHTFVLFCAQGSHAKCRMFCREKGKNIEERLCAKFYQDCPLTRKPCCFFIQQNLI